MENILQSIFVCLGLGAVAIAMYFLALSIKKDSK